MRSPTPRPAAKRTKPLPPPRTIHVEMRWQDGWWGWTDVHLDPPRRPLAAKWEKIGYRVLEYRLVPEIRPTARKGAK